MRGRIRRETQSAVVPIIGKVKVGEMGKKTRKNGSVVEFPRALDHFRATGKYASHFHDAFGDKPSTIQVVFISDDVQSVCHERMEIRDKQGRLYGFGDGVDFEIWSSDDEDYVSVSAEKIPSLTEKVARRLKTSWKVVLELRFLIPEVRGIAGVWQLHTKGEASSIPQIIGAFDFVKDQAGTVVGVPFDMSVEMVTSQKPESTSKFPVISLVPNISSGSMEKLHAALDAGLDIRRAGMLTEGKISEMTPKQIGSRYDTSPDDWGDPSDLTDEERKEYGV